MPLVLTVRGNYEWFPYCFTPFFMESGHENRETNTQDELYRNYIT